MYITVFEWFLFCVIPSGFLFVPDGPARGPLRGLRALLIARHGSRGGDFESRGGLKELVWGEVDGVSTELGELRHEGKDAVADVALVELGSGNIYSSGERMSSYIEATAKDITK